MTDRSVHSTVQRGVRSAGPAAAPGRFTKTLVVYRFLVWIGRANLTHPTTKVTTAPVSIDIEYRWTGDKIDFDLLAAAGRR